jgi:hypothetical protein
MAAGPAGRVAEGKARKEDNDGMGLPVTTPTADPPPDGQAQVRNPWAVTRAAVVAPFTRREGRELLFCLAGLPFVVVNPLALFVLAVDLTWLVAGAGRGNPSPADIAIAGMCLGLLFVLLVSTRAARSGRESQRRRRCGGAPAAGRGPGRALATGPAGGSWPTCWPSCRSA